MSGSEVRAIYAPQALIEFSREFKIQEIESREHLARLLDSEHLKDAWYAMIIRDYFTNGEFRDETIVEYPGRSSGSYPRARTAIYTLGGGREPWGVFDPIKIKVVIVPGELVNDPPEKTLADLMESLAGTQD